MNVLKEIKADFDRIYLEMLTVDQWINEDERLEWLNEEWNQNERRLFACVDVETARNLIKSVYA